MDPHRFQELFLSLLRAAPSDSLAGWLDAAEEAELSYLMDLSPLQDPLRYRARHYGLKTAVWLIDEKGELDRRRLHNLNRVLREGFHFIGPHREGDALIFAHLRASLRLLEEVPDFAVWLRKFSPPLCHKRAEAIVRDTLGAESIKILQPFHIRRAVLAAWLTLLRQTTGSCFATAPAVLVQQNYPLRFFKDLYELLSTGSLKTVFGGKEYRVPMSLSAASADLQKPLFALEALSPGLIKAFEAGGVLNFGALKELLQETEGAKTPEQLIRLVLLQAAGLTEDDLEAEAHLARIQMTPLLTRQSAVYYQKPSERAQKVADWKKRFAQACAAFETLAECALLRVWEYTIASFCDVKVEFGRWNLYIGLGFHPEEKEGIGEFLYQCVDGHLQQANRDIVRLHAEYEQAIHAVRSAEAVLANAASDAMRNRLRAELVGAIHAANAALEMRDRAVAKAEALSRFFSALVEQYYEKLQEYFQELFDPSLNIGEEAHLYDDSLAGFRLVYKHGRADASQWTPIYSGEEYIQCLRDFFSSVESEIAAPAQLGASVVAAVTTALIQFIQEPRFLQAALRRSQEKGRRSPWDYFSGGTMETLLQAYCGRERPFTESQCVPHSEEELLRFLLQEKRQEPLLMRSPTHAFLFYPALLSSKGEAGRAFWRDWTPDEAMQEHLAHRLSDRLPQAEKPLFLHLFRQRQTGETFAQFRIRLIEALQAIKNSRAKNKTALVDSFLFEQCPLLPLEKAKEALEAVFRRVSFPGREGAVPLDRLGPLMGPLEIYQTALALLLETVRDPISSTDWEKEIAEAMRAEAVCCPAPLLFADTNWSGWFFGFLANPATGQLELWRFNRTAMQGFPMSDWKEWLDERNVSPWVVLPKPEEYSAAF